MELFIAIVIIIISLISEKGAKIQAREQVDKWREQERKDKEKNGK